LIVADRVDSYVLELVAELLNGIVAHGVPETGSRLAKLDQAVADAEEELALYQEHTSIRDGVDAYNRGKAARAAAVEEAKAERERELAGMGGLDEEFVALLKLFDDLPMKHQRKVVRRLFDRITVHRLAPGASTHSPIEERVEIVENPLLTSSGVGDRDRP
jgi:hypothetical protein